MGTSEYDDARWRIGWLWRPMSHRSDMPTMNMYEPQAGAIIGRYQSMSTCSRSPRQCKTASFARKRTDIIEKMKREEKPNGRLFVLQDESSSTSAFVNVQEESKRENGENVWEWCRHKTIISLLPSHSKAIFSDFQISLNLVKKQAKYLDFV